MIKVISCTNYYYLNNFLTFCLVFFRFCIDTNNIFVAGHANGGMMAYRLACQLNSRISAIAVNAAGSLHLDYQFCMEPCNQNDECDECTFCFSKSRCPTETLDTLPHVFPCLMERPVSVLHMHGLLDTRVPYEGGIGRKQLGNATFAPIRTLIGKVFAEVYKCSSDTRLTFLNKTNPSDTTVCEEYIGCQDAQLQLCRLNNGGHHIPGSRVPLYCDRQSSTYKREYCRSWHDLLGPPSQSIRFAATSWQFFKSVSSRSKGANKGPRSALSIGGTANGSVGILKAYTVWVCVTLILIWSPT